MIQKSVLITFLSNIFSLTGCSFVPLQHMPVDANITINKEQMPLADQNDRPFVNIIADDDIRVFLRKTPAIDMRHHLLI